MSIAIAIVIGAFSGICAGMLGVGGGALIIPGLVLILGVEQHLAQGVALTVMPVTAVVGAIAQLRQGNVRTQLVLRIAPISMVFALLGAWIAGLLSARFLSAAFGLLLLLIGFKMIVSKEEGSVETH